MDLICLAAKDGDAVALIRCAEDRVSALKELGYTVYRLGYADPQCPPALLGILEPSPILKQNLDPLRVG